MKSMWWQGSWKIPDTPWHIRGYSRSAFRTGFYVPELSMMLDAGPQNFNKPDHILITHTHADHVAGLPMTMIARTPSDVHGNHQFHVYGPAEAQDFLSNYVRAMFYANAVSHDVNVYEWFTYYPLKAADTFNLDIKNTKLSIQVFECRHAIPTISYGLSEIKNKLKDEHLGLSGKELVALKKSGVEVTHSVQQRKLAYVCDTSIDVFALNPDLLLYPVIFIECTFFGPDELQQATDTKHVHWDQLKPYVVSNPGVTFVLFHFSQRYSDQEILEFFQGVCSGNKAMDNDKATPIKNIRCWIYGTAIDPCDQFEHNRI